MNNAVTANRSILLLHGVQSSQLTWWRLKADLQDVGWQVQVADLLGHGSRNAAGPADLTVERIGNLLDYDLSALLAANNRSKFQEVKP